MKSEEEKDEHDLTLRTGHKLALTKTLRHVANENVITGFKRILNFSI